MIAEVVGVCVLAGILDLVMSRNLCEKTPINALMQ